MPSAMELSVKSAKEGTSSKDVATPAVQSSNWLAACGAVIVFCVKSLLVVAVVGASSIVIDGHFYNTW